MKDMINSMDGIIQSSKNSYSHSHPPSQNWKICILLRDENWKIDHIEYIDNSNDIIVHWEKDKKKQSVRLNLEDQYRWMKQEEKNE